MQSIREWIAAGLWATASVFDRVEWTLSGLADKIAGPGVGQNHEESDGIVPV